MTEQEYLASLHPDARAAILRLMSWAQSTLGERPRVVSGRRTCAEQNALYAQGRTVPGGIVTNARGCISWHVQGRAVDLRFGPGGCDGYRPLADYWKAMGGRWGGDFPGFPDCVHFEWHPGVTIEQACPDPDACTDEVPSSFRWRRVVGAAALGFGVYVVWRAWS